MAKFGQNRFDHCDFDPWSLTMAFCMDIYIFFFNFQKLAGLWLVGEVDTGVAI